MNEKVVYEPKRKYVVQVGNTVVSEEDGQLVERLTLWEDVEYYEDLNSARKSADKLARTIKYVRVIVQQRNKKEENK